MFGCGAFVSWAVFAQPAAASVSATNDQKDYVSLMTRIESLEAAVTKAQADAKTAISLVNAVPVWVKSEIASKLVIADEIHVKKLIVFDHDNPDSCGRQVLSNAGDGSPIFMSLRKDLSIGLWLNVNDEQSEIYINDTAKQSRVQLGVKSDGTAFVRVLDEKPKPRLGLVSTPDGEAEFIRLDKFGNMKALVPK